MWFWRKTYFQTLKAIAVEASQIPEWTDYGSYCAEQERGLRQKAFVILSNFISRIEKAPFPERKRFVSWLLNRADLQDSSHHAMPHPLRKRVIEPTLNEWLSVDPNSSEPHRWLGGYDHLKQAIQINPSDEIASAKFVECILADVKYSTHELPHGYLGTPSDDLAFLAEAETASLGIGNGADRVRAALEIEEQRTIIISYLNSQKKQ